MTPNTWRMTPPAARFLSWGMGRDSSALALMSFHGELPLLDGIIAADTHWEPAEVYETLAWVTEIVSRKIPVYKVSTGDLGADILAVARRYAQDEQLTAGHAGQPPFWVRNDPNKDYATADSGGRLWRKCTVDYKIMPMRRKIRELMSMKPTGRLPKGFWIEQWIGFPKDELRRTFCSDVQWITNTFPLILPLQMTKRELPSWFIQHGYPVPPKSSCLFCPFHSNAYWRDMRDRRPDEWAKTIEFERQLHQGKLPGVRGTPYLHKTMVPLPLAPIEEPDTGEELFCLVCKD
jgi:hypothetical protein